jgi:hypothetical protein
MKPYAGVTEYAYGEFRCLGYKWGPAWVFHYDSPEMFDAAPFMVIVDVFGRLHAVYAPKNGLWDDHKNVWITVPAEGSIK